MSTSSDAASIVSAYADDPDMAELVELFLEELPDRVATIREALGQGDIKKVGQVAHQLKGAGGGYGFPAITEAGLDAEQAAKQTPDDLDQVRRTVDALVDVCNRASLG